MCWQGSKDGGTQPLAYQARLSGWEEMQVDKNLRAERLVGCADNALKRMGTKIPVIRQLGSANPAEGASLTDMRSSEGQWQKNALNRSEELSKPPPQIPLVKENRYRVAYWWAVWTAPENQRGRVLLSVPSLNFYLLSPTLEVVSNSESYYHIVCYSCL